MKRLTHVALVVALCGLTGLTVSSCKKKATKTAAAQIAADIIAVRERVQATIKDDVRRNNVLILLDDIDRAREQLVLLFLETQHKVHKNPDMPREEYEALSREFATARSNATKKIAAARITLRTHLTKEEWLTLFTREKKKKEDPTGLERYRAKGKAKSAADGNQDEAAATTRPSDRPELAESEVSP